ncbi:MAG: DUF1080 domain-containing protein [Lentisphaeraceae bacterium]|nr:DUF1080 domain-containing protein [Lentisphaeraceae bacterium]
MLQIKSSAIKTRPAWNVSSMPPGLINSLNADELADLIAYLFSAGNAADKAFKVTGSSQEMNLFDGKTLNGWKADPKLWSVQKGLIVGDTMDNKIKTNSFLVWDGEVGDFELTYEVKVEGDNNSGMMYRAQWLDKSIWRLKGNQCDLHPKPKFCAMLYSESTGRGKIALRGTKVIVDAKRGKSKVVGKTETATVLDISQWHTYKIIAKGNHLQHYVDGRLAVDVIDNHPKIEFKGLIGLQLHAGKPMKVFLRKITLKKL